MKITIYELYRRIYGEVPPKHIKVYDEDWYWNDYDGYVTKESLKTTPDAQIYLMDRYRTFMNLDKEVEIIEEPKKIEKIPLPSFDEFKSMSAEERYVIIAKEYDLLDELIDEINKLKED